MTEIRIMDNMVQSKSTWTTASSWMFYVIILLVISLPLSEFGMSVAQFLLLGFWMFEGADYHLKREGKKSLLVIVIINVAGKFRRLFRNHILLIFLLLYFYHVAGLFYTKDLNYAINDLRVKLPMLTLPILIATSGAINLKRFNIVMLFFTMAVTIGTLISMYVYSSGTISDPREISIFISHIRFSLFIVFSIFILAGFINFNSFRSKPLSILFTINAIWLVVFLFILKSFTGLIILPVVFAIFLFVMVFKNKWSRSIVTVLIVVVFYSGLQYVRNISKEFKVAEPIDKSIVFTKEGNSYQHDTINYGIEYGRYVGSYIAIDELRNSWNKRSEVSFDGLDNKGQELKYTLIRYLHSKGQKKDAEAVNMLTKDEIHQIENGLANFRYVEGVSIRGYIEQVLMGYTAYKKDDNPNASSLMQRFEYWKTGFYIINKNVIFGQGTGDVRLAFDEAYKETNTVLLPEFQHRAHNQYLTITIALGSFGLIIFILSLLYPPLSLGKFRNYYYLIFFSIIALSFLTEDTLETQAGATFFAVFSALLLFGIKKEVDENSTWLQKKNKSI